MTGDELVVWLTDHGWSATVDGSHVHANRPGRALVYHCEATITGSRWVIVKSYGRR